MQGGFKGSSELDSFHLKFKNILIAEKDAIMTLKSLSGRSNVTLIVDLGHVNSNAAGQPPRHLRVRRRDRRSEAAAEAAAAVAEKAAVVS